MDIDDGELSEDNNQDPGIPPEQVGRFITTSAAGMWFDGKLIADCNITLVCQREQPDGTHIMDLKIERHDVLEGGGSYVAFVPAEFLEDEKRINALGSSVARASWFFRSKNGSLAALKSYLHGQPGNNKIVVEVSQVGWVERFGCWVGEGGIIDASGRFHTWKAEGTEALSRRTDGSGGFRTRMFNLRKDAFGQDVPLVERPSAGAGVVSVYHTLRPKGLTKSILANLVQEAEPAEDEALQKPMADAREAFLTIGAAWHKNVGNFVGLIGMGYMTAAAVRHHVATQDRFFPHLYIVGRTGHGKDVLARNLAQASGMSVHSATSAGKETTGKAVRNKLHRVGNTPLWLNELRQNNSDQLLTLIRTTADMQSPGAITDVKQRDIVYQANRPLMLVGEVLVGTDAEHSRYVTLRLNDRPADKAALRPLESLTARFPPHWSTFLCDHNRAAWQIGIAANKLTAEFSQRGCDSRRARAWGLTAAGLAYWLDPQCHLNPVGSLHQDILGEMFTRAAEAMQFSIDDGAATQFWGVVQSLKARGILNNNGAARWARWSVERETGRAQIAIWHTHLAQVVSKETRDINTGLVFNELRADPGFIRAKNARLGGEVRHCFIYDGKSCGLPQWVIALSKEANKDANDDDNVEPEQLPLPSDPY